MVRSKHIPERMCVVCMEYSPKNELVRLTKDDQGTVLIDYTQKAGGRGVWIHKNAKCMSQLKKRKALERKFKCAIMSELFEELNNITNE